ncbi:peptidase M20 domain-containing 2 [Chytridium lagenaria]|nr:peptidase M20 domain-containing 2 [Chytridium lagenaria]
MIKKDAFAGCDIAIMVHPGRVNVTWARYLALQSLQVNYHGVSAHAAAAPWEGVNALDALVSATKLLDCYVSFYLLKFQSQQNLPTSRIHGIIKNGGAAPNVIPDHTSGEFYLRSEKVDDLYKLRKRVHDIFEGAALSSGCRVEVVEDPVFADVRINTVLAERFEKHARRLGCVFADRKVQESVSYGSTDMGNVTQIVPGIHPVFDIGCVNDIHTNEFREAAKTPEAIKATIRASKCMALTALDCILDSSLMAAVKEEFAKK